MRRRDFIGVIYCALGLPCGAAVQHAGKVWRIGAVFPLSPELVDAMRKHSNCVLPISAMRGVATSC